MGASLKAGMTAGAQAGTEAPTAAAADPIAEMLDGVRTRGAVFHQSARTGIWEQHFDGGSPLALIGALHGPALVLPQGGDAARLGPGDIAVLTGGGPYVVTDDHYQPTAPAVPVAPIAGGATTVPTLLFSGRYTMRDGVPGPLVAALPTLAIVRADEGSCPVSPTILDDLSTAGPGQQTLLDRTLDLMLIAALHAWFNRPGAPLPAWYRAHGDPVVGQALRLLDAGPDQPWTVATLAARTNTSRAALARRFTALVGRPPMTYLRERRLALAADLLRQPDATLAAVSRRVGFSSAFALSAAFKRELGISPSEYRARTTAAAP
ncbi:AraC family transcriptional regulator [Promicromonospora sp. NPDC023805]|uniref:AraC family transcriptional regulator n=1 Tax=Promicromonospora sp. NPDC023805 TaxID=3154696 RepID=UPI0033C5D48E